MLVLFLLFCRCLTMCTISHLHQHLPETQILPPSTNPAVENEPGKITFLDMKYLPYQVDTEFPCKIRPKFQGRIGRVRMTPDLWDRTSDNHAREDPKHSPTQMMQLRFLHFRKFQRSACSESEDWTLPGKTTTLILECPFTAEGRTQDKRDPWSELTQRSHSVTAHYYTKHRSVKIQDCR